MARKKQTDDSAAPASDAPKKGKSNLVPAIVIAVGLLGGGYFMSGGGGGKAAPAGAAAAVTSTTAEVVTGEIAKLDSVTINLSDGHYVKVGVALQLKEGIKAAEFETQGARALDFAISIFGNTSSTQLSAPGGRDAAKEELNKKVVEAYGGKVTAVYFTEFVMQ
jgi:flagellar FliL protein